MYDQRCNMIQAHMGFLSLPWNSIDWMRGAGMVFENVAFPADSAYFTGG